MLTTCEVVVPLAPYVMKHFGSCCIHACAYLGSRKKLYTWRQKYSFVDAVGARFEQKHMTTKSTNVACSACTNKNALWRTTAVSLFLLHSNVPYMHTLQQKQCTHRDRTARHSAWPLLAGAPSQSSTNCACPILYCPR